MRHTDTPENTHRTRKTVTPLLVAAGLALAGPGAARAGVLHDIYAGSLAGAPDANVTRLDAKAADQQVITEQRRYLPKLSLVARELWVYQDVRKSGNPLFPSGRDDYGNTRVSAELDQPIYDPTIRPQIEAAKARRQKVLSQGRQSSEWQTRLVVEGFLRSARFYELIRGTDRVIARLEKEQASVTKSYDAKVATLSDVQNVDLALASMRREHNNFTRQFYHELAALGVDSDEAKAGWVRLDPAADTAALTAEASGPRTQAAEIDGLKAEMNEAASQSTAARRRSWPVLSLYGAYDLDTAGGSVFGGSRDLSNYGLGLSVKWDIFSRGMNRSEARELAYRKEAKEAELKARQAEQDKAAVYNREFLEQSDRSVAELVDLTKRYEGLRDSAARAYEAGQGSYVNSITAYLAYESTVRELTGARHDRLAQQVACCGQTAGWNQALVDKVDTLFIVAK